jgi:glycosyltransferase involved in cell wall biosynthesis
MAHVDSNRNRYLAIVPAHNESGAIGATVTEIRRWASEFDVLVVDDGSSDDTALRAAATGVTVIRLPFNLGIGGAMQTGYMYARDHGYEVAVQVDGDGQHDPREIRVLLGVLLADPVADVVTGSRFLDPANGGYLSSPSRRAGNRLLSALVSLMTGLRITDATSGFRIADRRAIELFAGSYPPDYPEVESILLLHAHGMSSREVSVRMRPRLAGTSTISAGKPVYYMAKVLLALVVAFCRPRPAVQPRVEGAAVTAERVA